MNYINNRQFDIDDYAHEEEPSRLSDFRRDISTRLKTLPNIEEKINEVSNEVYKNAYIE